MSCKCNMDLAAKIMDIIGSCFMIALGIAILCGIWSYSSMFVIQYIVAIYFIIMGVFFILVEIPVQIIAAQFNFLKSLYGKAMFCFYLGLFCFSDSHWYTIVVGVTWWVFGLIFLIVALIFQFSGKGGVTIENSGQARTVQGK